MNVITIETVKHYAQTRIKVFWKISFPPHALSGPLNCTFWGFYPTDVSLLFFDVVDAVVYSLYYLFFKHGYLCEKWFFNRHLYGPSTTIWWNWVIKDDLNSQPGQAASSSRNFRSWQGVRNWVGRVGICLPMFLGFYRVNNLKSLCFLYNQIFSIYCCLAI